MIKLSIFSYQAEDGIRDRNVTGVQTRALPIFLLALGCVLGLSYRAARHWFRQAQQARDAARSEWINGVSHDIRTPLSVRSEARRVGVDIIYEIETLDYIAWLNNMPHSPRYPVK